jgi:hypothetical protein
MEHYFMGNYFTSTQLIVVAVVLGLVILIAIGAWIEIRKSRTKALRNRFGSEYDRAVLKHGSTHEAEANLDDRKTRVDALTIRELGVTERDRFVAEWQTVQSRFVDYPREAVTEADNLVKVLLEARGYPQASFEQRAADVSVHYPRVMENYRIAHSVAVRIGQIQASTEELRTAMIQYRSIFDDLLQAQKPTEIRTAA